jgi:hypothetical protein
MVIGNLACISKGATMVYPAEIFDPLATLKVLLLLPLLLPLPLHQHHFSSPRNLTRQLKTRSVCLSWLSPPWCSLSWITRDSASTIWHPSGRVWWRGLYVHHISWLECRVWCTWRKSRYAMVGSWIDDVIWRTDLCCSFMSTQHSNLRYTCIVCLTGMTETSPVSTQTALDDPFEKR